MKRDKKQKVLLTKDLLITEKIVNQMTVKEIAIKYGWSEPTVTKKLREYKIEYKRKDIRDVLTKEQFYDLYFVQNMTINEIARLHNTTYIGTLLRQVKEWGFSTERGTFTQRQKDSHKKRKHHDELCGSLLSKIRSGIKQRTKNGRVIEFNITLSDIWNQFIKQNKKCAISGIELSFPKNNPEYLKYEWTASVDRIDSNKGYTVDNIQIVHKKINIIKFDMSTEELISWCKIIMENNNPCL